MKKILILLLLLLISVLFFGCLSTNPKIKIDYISLTEAEKESIKYGMFKNKYNDVLNAVVDVLEIKGWNVLDIRKVDGLVKTEVKSNTYCQGIYGIIGIFSRIEKRKGKIRVKWFCSCGSNQRVLEKKDTEMWNYLVLMELKK